MHADPATALAELRITLVGEPVSFRRLAGNSLLVYFGGDPGEGATHVIWLEPTWHMVGPEGVLAGSRQAQDSDPEEGDGTGFAAAGRALDELMGQELRSIDVDVRTHDLTLTFSRDLALRTFVADPRDDETWYVKENGTGHRLEASPRGLRRFDRA